MTKASRPRGRTIQVGHAADIRGDLTGPTARMRISVLGPFELQRDGRPVPGLPRKAQALLSFLVLNRGRPTPKEKLATLLWGNSGSEQAGQSLRQCMVSVRKALGAEADGLLLSDATTVSLAVSNVIAADVTEFEMRLEAADLDGLEAANALYRDEFLAGLSIPIEPFERWVTIERQRFASMRLGALQRLAIARADAGRIDKAIAAGRQLIELDPLREEGHRLVMRLLADTGNRSGALLHYERCVRLLRDELDIAPDAETVRLAETMRSGSALPPVVASMTADTLPVGTAARRDAQPFRAFASVATVEEDLPHPDGPSIVILPFSNLGGDPGNDYFVQGLVEDITVALGREKWLFVIAAPSALAANDGASDLRAIGARLGVRYVLRGSIRANAGKVLFVVQLHDARLARHVWSGRFEDRIDNLFAMQDRLTTKVAATIAPALMSVEVERAHYKPTDNLTAFDLYLRALPRFRTSRKDNEEALALLDRAIALDPDYAAAYALSARCYQFQLMFDWRSPGDPGFVVGVHHGREAASKGRNDSEALWMAGLALVHLAGEMDHSLALIERSLALNPNSANACIAGCLVHSYLGNSEAAIDHFQKAQRLNPLDLSQHLHWNMVAWAYLGAGRYEEAADAAERTLRVQPDYPPGLRLGAVTCGLLGRIEEGRAYTARLLAKQPKSSIAWMRAFLEVPLQRNKGALEAYLDGARRAGVPET